MKRSHRSNWTLGAYGVGVVLILASAGSLAARMAQPLAGTPSAVAASSELSYVFRYVADPEPRLIVDLRFREDANGPKQLVLPNQYGGQGEMWRSISELAVVDGPIELQPGNSPDVRNIRVKGDGLCHIRYVVTGRNEPLGRSVYYWPILRQDYMHLLGKALFVKPDLPVLQHASVKLSWYLPKHWTFGDSFGVGEHEQKLSTSIFELEQGVYVGGDFRFRRFRIRGRPGAVALRGEWGFSDDDFENFINRIVTTERAFWNDDAFSFFLVTVLPVDIGPGSYAGVGRWNGFAAFMPPHAKLDSSFRYLLAHELFHTWNPTKVSRSAGVPPTLYWFSEGFTDYYAYLFLMLEGFESFPDYVDRMNKMITRYWGWRTRNLPNEAAARDYYSDPEAQKLAYFRGMLVALNWNAAIREASRGKASLNDLMRALKRRAENKGEALTPSILIDEARRFGIGAAGEQIRRWVDHGDTVEVRADSFGPCAELVSRGDEPPQFRLTQNRKCEAWFR